MNGASKGYAMTGWRVGFCGGPRRLIAAMENVQGQSTNGISTVGQAAAVAALDGPQDLLKDRVADLDAFSVSLTSSTVDSSTDTAKSTHHHVGASQQDRAPSSADTVKLSQSQPVIAYTLAVAWAQRSIRDGDAG